MKTPHYLSALESYGSTITSKMNSILHSQGSNFGENIEHEVEGTDLSIRMPYVAVYVDGGRKPGKMPSMDSLVPWARSRSIPKDALFAIAYVIGRDGTEGKDFMRVFQEGRGKLYKAVHEALVKDVMEALN